MASVQTQAALIVATSELLVVRLLRDAIRTADLSGGKVGPGGAQPAGNPCPVRADRFVPEPRIEPRMVFHPTPRFEPRVVYHPVRNLPCHPREGCVPECEKAPAHVSNSSPLPAPWMQPIWKNPIQHPPIVKVFVHLTDVHNKGSLIDVFL